MKACLSAQNVVAGSDCNVSQHCGVLLLQCYNDTGRPAFQELQAAPGASDTQPGLRSSKLQIHGSNGLNIDS